MATGVAVAALVALIFASSAAGQRVRITARAKSSATPLHEGAIILQGVDSVAFLDSAHMARAADMLNRVRAHIEELGEAPAQGQFWSIELWLDRELGATAEREATNRPNNYWATWSLTRTAVDSLDRLNERFAVRSLRLQRRGLGADFARASYVLRLDFTYAMNLPAVVAVYERVPGVLAAAPTQDEGVQPHNIYRVTRRGTTWALLVDVGTGDCRAGCTTWIRHAVRFDERTGEAVHLSRIPVP